jgi:outer membrane protein OmpA-like peptidoglycan-associated protein
VFTPPAQHRRPAKETESKEINITEDEPGCKDSGLMSRMAGCSILQCDTKESDTVELQTGNTPENGISKESLDGPTEVIYYLCPSKISHSQIIKNAETNLTKSGYKVIHTGEDAEQNPILTAVKDTQWVQVSTYVYNSSSAYIQTAVNAIPETPSSTETIAEEFTKDGRVTIPAAAVDDVNLSADIQKVLIEIASVLQRHAEWKLRVEVHEDATGEKSVNRSQSEKSALILASWLKQHGVDENRVSAQGVGDSRPVADNTTENGRAKNRRIEFVRF